MMCVFLVNIGNGLFKDVYAIITVQYFVSRYHFSFKSSLYIMLYGGILRREWSSTAVFVVKLTAEG